MTRRMQRQGAASESPEWPTVGSPENSQFRRKVSVSLAFARLWRNYLALLCPWAYYGINGRIIVTWAFDRMDRQRRRVISAQAGTGEAWSRLCSDSVLAFGSCV